MISAQKAEIEKISCKNNLLSIEWGKVSGHSFHRSISTNSSFGDMPFVQDPYEASTVKIGPSSLPISGMVPISC